MVKKRIGALIIKDKRLLLVNGLGSDVYWTPGGKSEHDELAEETLKRELKEELDIEIVSHEFFHKYTIYESKFKSDTEFSYYLADFEGKITPSNEVDRVLWVSSQDIEKGKVKVSEGVKELIPLLAKKKLI